MSEYTKDSPASIANLFDTIAKEYDRANGVLSFSMHLLWNRALVKALAKKSPKTFADLCGGTGAITARLCKEIPIEKSYILDFSKGMLEVAKSRLLALPIETIACDIGKVPLEEATVDAAAIAYGIRNVKDRKAGLEEAYRILKAGGTFAILELTRPKSPILKMLHKAYLSLALPVVGKLLTKNKDAYSYLSESVKEFIPASTLAMEVEAAGFCEISVRPMSLGAATLITATKRF